jgi:Cu/Ag efflux protein CusF
MKKTIIAAGILAAMTITLPAQAQSDQPQTQQPSAAQSDSATPPSGAQSEGASQSAGAQSEDTSQSAGAQSEGASGGAQATGAGAQNKEMQGRRAVIGQVVGTRDIQLKGVNTKHRLVKIRNAEGQTMVVNVGDATRVKGAQFKQGSKIIAIGKEARINGDPVLFAKYVGDLRETGVTGTKPGATSAGGQAETGSAGASGETDSAGAQPGSNAEGGATVNIEVKPQSTPQTSE